jgi:hypothetical protein
MIAASLVGCAKHKHEDARRGPVIVADSPRNFGKPITVKGRIVFDGEAPLFVSTHQSTAYWLVNDPPEAMSKLRASHQPGTLSCIEAQGTASISGNLISRHMFINHRGIKFERLKLGRSEPDCTLSAEESKLMDTEV